MPNMPPNALRNVLAVIAGFVIGSAVNMALITVSASIIPPPAGVNVSDPASLSAGIGLFTPRHFLFPFLAHALGTLTGALAAYLIAASHRAQLAYAVGVLFLCGGIAAVFMIPAPTWFVAADLLLAYLPMAWLAVQIGTRATPGNDVAQAQAA